MTIRGLPSEIKFCKKIYELGKPPSKSEFRVWEPWIYLEAILLNELRV